MVLAAVLSSVVDNVVDYCSKQETRERLESKVVAPMMQYLADKFAWGVRLFQVVAILVFVQTLVLLWLLARELRRPPLLAPLAL